MTARPVGMRGRPALVRVAATIALVLAAGCGGDGGGASQAPPTTPSTPTTPTVTTGTFDVRLAGATGAHAAAVVELAGIPDGSTVTAAGGVTLYTRSRGGQGLVLFLAGDLTGSAVVRLTTPTSAGVSPRGTVLELSAATGLLVEGALPTVAVTAVTR